MKHDIVLAGVGGQGILTIAAIIGEAALRQGLHVKQSEVHGMAQRGGAVLAHLRLNSEPIHSDLIAPGSAAIVLAVEPMEALRQAESLSPQGVILTNARPVRNVSDYPELDEVLAALRAFPRNLVIDAEQMAQDAGNARAMNMVMLGAVSPFLDFPDESLTTVIRDAFARKGPDVVAVNLKAFAAGREAALAVKR
ncbi:MAG: indolepyruvate oxidoreductase subunit beta [Lentisphaerae bacterium]|jgi:indolepyruvate ferredoxin oxidoreductase beta subunit|nr:indolepyruvate oxidoreductase subunit beta [Lentisphaerota bacterium]